MKQYKTLENWKSYEKGNIVPEEIALKFLENYMYFEDQSILEVTEIEEPKEEFVVKNDKGETFEEVMSKNKNGNFKETKQKTKKSNKK